MINVINIYSNTHLSTETPIQYKINYPVRFLFFAIILLWTTGFFFPVLNLNFNGAALINYILKFNYGLVCNQSQEATFTINSSYLLVCARCTGLYTGALAMSVLLLFYNIKPKQSLLPLILFSLPLLFDVISVRAGLYEYSKTVALFTGVLCGSVIYLYILETVENSYYSLNRKADDVK